MKKSKMYVVKSTTVAVAMALANAVYAADSGVVSSSSVTRGSETSASGTGLSDTQWNASVGLGYDTNIYQAPDKAYVDYGPTTPVNVTPKTYSGLFVPLAFEVEHTEGVTQENNIVAKYDFSGDFYTNPDYRNADVSSHTVKLGDEYVFAKKGRLQDVVYGNLIYISKKDEYTERDTGTDKLTSGGVNISSRYEYKGNGFELGYKNRTSDIKYEFKYKLLNRDYKDAVAISQLDHKYTLLSGRVKFPINKVSKLQLKYSHFIYDYKERPARDVNGRLFASSPALEYVYNEYELSYYYKFNPRVRTYFDYSYKTRSDEYVGYNDYTRNLFDIRVLYDYSKNTEIKATVTYWTRDYPNAFAFDRFVTGLNEDDKKYDGTTVAIEGDYFVDKRQSYWFNVEWHDENSTDLRYEYSRVQVMAGVKWQSKH